MKLKRFKKIAIFLALTLIFASLAACSSTENRDNSSNGGQLQEEQPKEESKTFPVEITDMLGRTVKVEEEPQRIVSITPSSTEILFALGLGDKVVAVSNQCDYPEEAKSKEKVGDFFQPNYEQIAAAEPDLLFVGNSAPPDSIAKFEELGISVVSLEAADLDGTYQSILDTGKLTGTLDKAQAIVDEMKQKVEEIEGKVKDTSKPSVYFVVSYGNEGNYTAGPGSFIHDLISMAGGRNIAGDLEQAWAEFSLEKLVEEDPEFIILPQYAKPEEIKALEGYKELTAIKEDKLIMVEENLVVRPGPRLVQGLEQIAKAIHPELFK